MSVLVNEFTRVICQGFTATQGAFGSEWAITPETRAVGGISFAADDAATTMRAVQR